MALTKKKRFEVFKRDGFQCMYCGNAPPDVILEVDHIVPTSKGGEDELNNLLTACFGCNRGKSNIPLDKAPSALAENLEVLKQKEEQLREYNKYVAKLRRQQNKQISLILSAFDEYDSEKGISTLLERSSLTRFLSLLPLPEILDAIDCAFRKFDKRGVRPSQVVRYFYGVCWAKVRERQDD